MQNNLTGRYRGIAQWVFSVNTSLVSTFTNCFQRKLICNLDTNTGNCILGTQMHTQVGMRAAQINSAVFGVFTKAYTSPVSTFTNWQTLSRHSQLMQAETLIVLILRQDMFSSSTSWKYVFSRHSIGLITDREGSKTVACARDYT